ncbi:hypothetical protein T439DRAFT_214028 [Meredithblackwellia eburnea MCA 4105]
MSQWKRPPSPPLRIPSPLGKFTTVRSEDGVVVGAPARPPERPASCPPVQDVPPRPPSAGGVAPPLRPPVEQARKVSMMELQKIDCQELRTLLSMLSSELTRFVRAVLRVQNRITRMWSVPQRTAKVALRDIANGFAGNCRHLIQYLQCISLASRKILNFIATRIKDTHGLKDFVALENISTVLSELQLLRSYWMQVLDLEKTFKDVLKASAVILYLQKK